MNTKDNKLRNVNDDGNLIDCHSKIEKLQVEV